MQTVKQIAQELRFFSLGHMEKILNDQWIDVKFLTNRFNSFFIRQSIDLHVCDIGRFEWAVMITFVHMPRTIEPEGTGTGL